MSNEGKVGKYLKDAIEDHRILMTKKKAGLTVGKGTLKIKNYLNVNDAITQKDEFGFIKLGSRVDIFLPLDVEVKVNLNDKVKGGQTVLAHLSR